MKTPQQQVQELLQKLGDDQKGFIEAVARDRAENKIMLKQLVDLKKEYSRLWKIMITILHFLPERELRIHDSQFLRFKEEYRIDQSYDKETKEVVLKLLTFGDEVGGG